MNGLARRSLKVAWLAPYPVQLLEPRLQLSRRVDSYHACSWIVALSQALSRMDGIELHLLTETQLVRHPQTVKLNNITFHVLKNGVPFTSRGFPPWLPLEALTGFQFNVRRFVRELREIRPDLVHAHGTETSFAPAAAASGCPCLVSIQGIVTEYYRTNPSFGFRIVRYSEQRVVRQARYFTCRTQFDSSFVHTYNPAAKIFMIHEAMNPAYFENQWLPSESHRVLYVGSAEKRKGLATLLEAIARVRQQIPDVTLDVIGGGEQLRPLCAQLQIESCVNFLGRLSAPEIACQHLQAQVFVLPSENENSPNALAEAMVSGMPVIASAVGGIPSMVNDGVTGLLVPPRDPGSLADRIVRLLKHPEERERLGRNARQVACERHHPERIAADTVAAYNEILRAQEWKP